MVARTRNLNRLSRCLLVFLARANAIHGKTAGLPIRMGSARSRPHRPRLRGRNAQTSGDMCRANEEAMISSGGSCSAGVSPAPLRRNEKLPAGRRRYENRPDPNPAVLSNSFEQNRDALANAYAHGRQRIATLDALQLPRSRQNEPCPAHSQWMPQCDCATIGIHLFTVVWKT